MWKLKEEAEGATRKKNAEKMKLILEGLKSTIRELKRVEVGINVNREKEGAWDVVLLADFETELDMTMYARHENHKKALNFITSVTEDRRFVDYEMDV